MALKQIHISQTSAQIEIQTKRAELRVLQSRKLQLSMRQIHAQMQVETRRPKLNIDQTQCFAESGLKTSLEMAHAFYKQSMAKGMQAIQSIAEEGLRFLQIEKKGNPFAEVAWQRGVHFKQPVVTAMPQSRPKVTFEPGEVKITWTHPRVEMEWHWIESQVEYIPYEVNITMLSYPSIDIRLEEGVELHIPHWDRRGRLVDEKQ